MANLPKQWFGSKSKNHSKITLHLIFNLKINLHLNMLTCDKCQTVLCPSNGLRMNEGTVHFQYYYLQEAIRFLLYIVDVHSWISCTCLINTAFCCRLSFTEIMPIHSINQILKFKFKLSSIIFFSPGVMPSQFVAAGYIILMLLTK